MKSKEAVLPDDLLLDEHQVMVLRLYLPHIQQEVLDLVEVVDDALPL